MSVSKIMVLLCFPLILGKHKNSLGELLTVRSSKLLVMGSWYKVRIGKYGRKLYLFVDNVINTGVISSSDTLRISGDDIYLGKLFIIRRSFSTVFHKLPKIFGWKEMSSVQDCIADKI